jgi:hypothetical protein
VLWLHTMRYGINLVYRDARLTTVHQSLRPYNDVYKELVLKLECTGYSRWKSTPATLFTVRSTYRIHTNGAITVHALDHLEPSHLLQSWWWRLWKWRVLNEPVMTASSSKD